MSPTGSDPTLVSQNEPLDLEQRSSRESPTNDATTEKHDSEKKHDPAFEVSWDGDDDPACPHNFPKWRKWSQVLITSSTSLCVTCTSSLYTSTYDQIEVEFNSSRIVCTLGLSLFVAGLGLSPMLLGPMSEFYGRKPIYIFSLLLFIIWIIPSAVAHNMATMLVARFIDGFAGSAFLTVAGGTVGDLFTKMELQAPMVIFTSSPFLGPIAGPIIGGFINDFANWRWSFYVLIIWSFVQWIAVVSFVPETYHPVLLRNKARKMRKETGDDRWYAPIEKLDRSIAQVSM
jgi:multidrug resistance protein